MEILAVVFFLVVLAALVINQVQLRRVEKKLEKRSEADELADVMSESFLGKKGG